MSGPPQSTRDALVQAMAQRQGAAAAPAQAASPQDDGSGQMAQACGMVGQLLMALASNPQAIAQIMASAQGGAPQGPTGQ